MSKIKQDFYILGQSSSKPLKKPREEIRLDLQLFPQTLIQTGKVTGIVTDSNGKPIPNALVKVMDMDYNPIEHTITGNDGTHTIHNLPSGCDYTIFATAAGKALNQGNSFTMSSGSVITRNFMMEDDPSTKLGVVAGDLYDSTTKLPIEGAIISLYQLNSDGTELLVAVTYTNEYGQFVFRELNLNSYIIRTSMLGYFANSDTIKIQGAGQIIPSIIYLTPDPDTDRGTISGMITDNYNQPIGYADVILYKVNADRSLTAVAFTKTNVNGVYLFMNVDQAEYVVKSNQTVDLSS